MSLENKKRRLELDKLNPAELQNEAEIILPEEKARREKSANLYAKETTVGKEESKGKHRVSMDPRSMELILQDLLSNPNA